MVDCNGRLAGPLGRAQIRPAYRYIVVCVYVGLDVCVCEIDRYKQ